VGCAVALGAAFLPGAVGWLTAAGVAALTVWFLARAHSMRRSERVAARECARAARVLAALMRSGQIPTVALASAAADCPVLASAATAARIGGDVGAELERAAARPGHAALLRVAAAWRVSERVGAPIADVLSGVSETIRAEQRVTAMVDAELSAARTSGHIMAVLPFLAIALGHAVGVDPVAFLMGEPFGQALVVASVVLTAAGVLWIDRLARPGGAPR